MKSATLQALHSSATPEHGSPPDIIEAARRVLGGIDLDPASSAVFNEFVKAERFYTKEDDGLSQPWSGRVFLNPPSGDNGKLVKAFWERLTDEYFRREVESAIYIGFSIDQLQTLQNTQYGGPLQLPICVPSKRLQFVTALEAPTQQGLFGTATGSAPVLGESPTKPNFVCLLPSRVGLGAVGELEKERFVEEFGQFGEVRI